MNIVLHISALCKTTNLFNVTAHHSCSPTPSPVVTGRALVGLAPPKQNSKPLKLKYETLQISGMFVKFECQAPRAPT